MRLAPASEASSDRNSFRATVRDVYFLGRIQEIQIDIDGTELRVIEVRGNATPLEEKHRCSNRRAEMYAQLADRLDPAQNAEPFALPDDRELMDELVAPEKVWQGSDGLKFRLTPKARRPGQSFKGRTVSERLGRSPDKADAVAYCYQAVRKPLSTLASWVEAGAF